MSAGIGAIAQVASALFLSSGRSIGPYVPHVIVEEQHRDDSVITEFPVETGAAITDHTYERPPTLVLRVGWSDSTAGIPGYVRIVYQQLLALKASRRPFNVATGKRLYQQMLFASLDVITDGASENSLMVIAALRKINLTSTQSTRPNTAKPAQDSANQANPESTGSVADRGAVQTQDVSAQNFAGSFNPGAYSPDGGSVGNGSFGLGGINPPAATAVDMGQLTGLSPATEIMLPELSVTAPTPVGGLQGAGPDQYNMFGGGP
ncbi:hypothetical protein LOK46_10540 [Methylobacterium sp. NMS14P]|uniref:phage baseplate protein n=1 Tax=Methylobacterium sp. NMS14P TaxID=2894310 RepID=UPI002359F433|nr:hypothetical protein [Methylobacterium sp. NMS14P]WCS27227.1 hypothetical protein LOK46_10540 [Methylobacterium sp. NMS14P]